MHILYLHQHFTTRAGTSGTRSYEFSRLLHQKGHDVTIICGRWGQSGLSHHASKLVEEHQIDGLRVLALNVPYGQQMSYVRRMLSFILFMLLAAWVAVRQRKIDVIYATSTPLTIAVPAMIAALIRRKPFVFEVRDLWPEVPIGMGILRNRVLVAAAEGLEWLTYRRAKHIVALSPGMKDGIIKKGIKPEKITIIPNASDNDLFDVPPQVGLDFRVQHPELGSGPLVVYTGTLGKVNQVTYLVRLAGCVRALDDQIRFLLVGSGGEAEKVRALAQELGVLNRTFFMMDPVPRQEMPTILSAATVASSTVLPNPVLWANSANKFFDALAAGRPMVINHEGWQADLLRRTGAGVVLDAENSEAAAHQLVDALHNPAWIERASTAARKLAQEDFARDRLAVVLESVLQQAAH
jgi:glycosyltransferase involved in cell wall biosynthesis